MNGVLVERGMPVDQLGSADAIVIGSGTRGREFAADAQFLAALTLDPETQLIGSQCSGALILEGRGLLKGVPVCTDEESERVLRQAGIRVLNQPLFA
jgi:transcriptional regulator GlxA family with amidase domain